MNADHHHTHGVRTATGFARRDVARLLRRITVSCALLIIVGAIVLWPDGGEIRCRPATAWPLTPLTPDVTSVEELPCRSDPRPSSVTS